MSRFASRFSGGMTMRVLLSVLAFVLMGTSVQAQIYHANDTGGIIPWSCENEANAHQIAAPRIARAGTNITASLACTRVMAILSPSIFFGRRTSILMRYPLCILARAAPMSVSGHG